MLFMLFVVILFFLLLVFSKFMEPSWHFVMKVRYVFDGFISPS